MFAMHRLVFGFSVVATALLQNAAKYAEPTPLPANIADDSYTIYQQVLPSNAIEWSEVDRTQWLVENVTTAKPLDASYAGAELANLHHAVKPPADRSAEWNEVLADFDFRCHERYTLDASRLHEAVPLHLMDAAAQQRYWQGVAGYRPPPGSSIMQAPPTPNEFAGAAGLHSFSAVYFNRAHTLAAVYFGMGCGSLCGNWTWVVLEKRGNGEWTRLPWATVVTMS